MTRTSVVVYTADVGGHDAPWPIATQEASDLLGPVDVQTVRFDTHRKSDASWNDHHPATAHPPGLNPRLAGRWYKTHPHVLFPRADVTIWVDACLEVHSPQFVAYAVQDIGDHDLALYRHPDRDSVYPEVRAAATLAKYDGAAHQEMVDEMDAVGFTPDLLWAMTTMVRRPTPNARLVDFLTWELTKAWSSPAVTALDQLILPYVIAWTGAEAARLTAGTLWSNPHFRRHPHRRET